MYSPIKYAMGTLFGTMMAGLAIAQPLYSVSDIPEDLLTNANAVVQNYEEEFELITPGKARHTISATVTIFKAQGNNEASLAIFYDKFSTVNFIEAEIFDRYGKSVRKVRSKDIQDYSSFSSISILEDNRVKVVDMEYNQYPYTVQYRYSTTKTNMMFFPVWRPLDTDNKSVVQATFRVIAPSDYELRYQTYHLDPPTITAENGNQILTWQAKNLLPRPEERLEPNNDHLLPEVITGPTSFEVAGYSGDMSSWEAYGQFINQLNQDRNDLSEERKAAFRDLVADQASTADKVKTLYEHLQKNTRYVSIQLGIGGWQPFRSAFVDEQGYGDCKALSFYMKSMLEAVDIPAYYTLIYAGSRGINHTLDPEFPYSRFNHAILAVPNGNDTIWLECTDQTNPFDYQGLFTGNREALMITPSGGKLVNTTRYTPEENRMETIAHVNFDNSGNAEIEVRSTYKGLQYSTSNISGVIHKDQEEQRKWLYNAYTLSSFDIASMELSENRDGAPSTQVIAKLNSRRAANVSGKRMFLTPNLLNQLDHSLPKTDTREAPMEIAWGYEDIDSVYITVPEGYYPEVLPEDYVFDSEFGSYEGHFEFSEEGLLYVRRYMRKEGKHAAEAYNDYVDFLTQIEKADRAKIVLVNRT